MNGAISACSARKQSFESLVGTRVDNFCYRDYGKHTDKPKGCQGHTVSFGNPELCLKNRGRLGPRFHNCAGAGKAILYESKVVRYSVLTLTISSSFSFYIWSRTTVLNKSRIMARPRSITASHKNRERISKPTLITSCCATGLDSKKSFLLFSSQCATHRTLPIKLEDFSLQTVL